MAIIDLIYSKESTGKRLMKEAIKLIHDGRIQGLNVNGRYNIKKNTTATISRVAM